MIPQEVPGRERLEPLPQMVLLSPLTVQAVHSERQTTEESIVSGNCLVQYRLKSRGFRARVDTFATEFLQCRRTKSRHYIARTLFVVIL
jgi:ribosomal protein L34